MHTYWEVCLFIGQSKSFRKVELKCMRDEFSNKHYVTLGIPITCITKKGNFFWMYIYRKERLKQKEQNESYLQIFFGDWLIVYVYIRSMMKMLTIWTLGTLLLLAGKVFNLILLFFWKIKISFQDASQIFARNSKWYVKSLHENIFSIQKRCVRLCQS